MARMLAVLVVVGVAGFIVWSLSGVAQGIAAARRGRAKPGTYEFESRVTQTKRRMKGVRGPAEEREAILSFVESRTGVEAYFEPKTVTYPLSVVLVAHDGEWKRFELADDSFIRGLAKDRGIPTLDAARVGYPQRMREYKRRESPDDPAGSGPTN